MYFQAKQNTFFHSATNIQTKEMFLCIAHFVKTPILELQIRE